MLVIVGKTCCCSTGVKYVCCTMCVNLSAFFVFLPPHLWPPFCWAKWNPFASSASRSPLFVIAPLQHTSFLPLVLALISFSASGQNNSSQLTPISSLALRLQHFFSSFLSSIHHDGPTGCYFKWMVSTLAKHLPPTHFETVSTFSLQPHGLRPAGFCFLSSFLAVPF